MTVVEGAWLLTMTGPPVRNGRVAVEQGRVIAVGAELAERTPDLVLADTILMPGMVNAHTHLELSYLLNAVPPRERFTDWVSCLMQARRSHDEAVEPRVMTAAHDAARQMRETGTVLVGDVSNTLQTPVVLNDAGLSGVVFYELTGFGAADRLAQVRDARALADALSTPEVRVSLAAHAPYSVSPALFSAIRADRTAHPMDVSTVHVAEGAEEVELLRSGHGPWRDLIEKWGAWNPEWVPPGQTPIAYLDDMGIFDDRMLAVHGVQADGPDFARLRANGTTLVSCPRSNQWVGAGVPPIDAFYVSHVRLAFGTDSLASVSDLNLFSELAEARRLAPRVPARWLLESATRVGATALGFGSDFGAIEAGKVAALLAIRAPAGVPDPEEYLVGGIHQAQVSWVDWCD